MSANGSEGDVDPVPARAFYCMSSEEYFFGAVAMVNSLRLHGHGEPIFLLDLGLAPHHRALLEGEARVLPAPPGLPPWLLKTVAPLAHPAGRMLLIDVDMIVTRPLDPLFERAGEGRVVAFENDRDRFDPMWREALDLGPLERRPYLCSGLVAMPRDPGEELLRLIDDRQRRVEVERTFFSPADDPAYPLRFLDQDVLNAVLQATVESERVVSLPNRLAPNQPFAELRVVDERTLRCSYDDGIEPYVLHHLARKPWLEIAYHGAYSRLLRRLLLADDVAIRVDPSELPLALRSGRRARIARRTISLLDLARWNLTERLPARIRGHDRVGP
jgi:hypothetical protein